MNSHSALTPTILFMASSLRDSLLLSSISLRSSFLRTENTVVLIVANNRKSTAEVTNQLDQRCCESYMHTTSVSASQIIGVTLAPIGQTV